MSGDKGLSRTRGLLFLQITDNSILSIPVDFHVVTIEKPMNAPTGTHHQRGTQYNKDGVRTRIGEPSLFGKFVRILVSQLLDKVWFRFLWGRICCCLCHGGRRCRFSSLSIASDILLLMQLLRLSPKHASCGCVASKATVV